MNTIRQLIKELLLEESLSSLELSQRLSVSEKDVLDHLAHIARAPGPGYRFQIIPAICKNCGFAFKKRERLTIPSRCPICHHESIRRPRFALLRQNNRR
jgi:transcriptional regulator